MVDERLMLGLGLPLGGGQVLSLQVLHLGVAPRSNHPQVLPHGGSA